MDKWNLDFFWVDCIILNKWRVKRLYSLILLSCKTTMFSLYWTQIWSTYCPSTKTYFSNILKSAANSSKMSTETFHSVKNITKFVVLDNSVKQKLFLLDKSIKTMLGSSVKHTFQMRWDNNTY